MLTHFTFYFLIDIKVLQKKKKELIVKKISEYIY